MFIELAKFILLPCAVVVYAFFYPCLVLVVSTLSTTVVEISDEFCHPKYVVETFVEYAWPLTTAVLLLFVLCTQYTLTAGHLFRIWPPCLRLLANLGLSCVGKLFIHYLSVLDGECSDGAYKTPRECAANERLWLARSVPFASFIAFYAMLVLLEETRVYEEWEELEAVVRRKYELDAMCGTSFRARDSANSFADVEKVIASYGRNTAIVKIAYVLLAVIMVLLHLANVVIVIYTSTPLAVVVASLVAVLIWSVTYRFVYRVQFCTLKKSVHRTKIEEYIAVAECNSEKNNVIEEMLASNDIRRNASRTTWLLSRMYKPYSYNSL